MCVVSMIGDHYTRKLPTEYPWVVPYVDDHNIPTYPFPFKPNNVPVSRAEFEALKKDVQEALELLKRAKNYDEENNEPDCEVEDKVVLLKKIAALVGVDLSEVFGDKK